MKITESPAHTPAEDWTTDTLFGGHLRLKQPRHGYRFSVDAVLLAHFVRPKPGWQILDLGCGCGVVGLIAAYRTPDCRVIGLEMQPELVALARENLEANGFADRVQVLEADVREIRRCLTPECCDLVLCNPPYYQQGQGRIRPDAQAAAARHDLAATLDDFVRAAAFALKTRSKAVFIFPASSQARLQQRLMAARLAPKRVQMAYSYPEADRAALVLVESIKNGGDACIVLPPLYLHTGPGGAYSPAMQRLYQEAPCWPKF